MTQNALSWVKENYFLGGLFVALFTVTAYVVRLETRVSIMETRGAEYTVAQMEEMKQRITVLEQSQSANAARLERIVDIMTKGGQPK